MNAIDFDKLGRNEPPEAKPKAATGGKAPRRKATDTRRRHDRSPLEVRLRESITAIAGWIRERGDEELGEILERDAGKMADVFGKLAKVNPVAKQAVSFLADVLEPVRAFGPTLRVLWRRLLERRTARLEELRLEPEELLHEVVVPGPVEPELGAEQAEPWRIPE